jgi:hypothetical protein
MSVAAAFEAQRQLIMSRLLVAVGPTQTHWQGQANAACTQM